MKTTSAALLLALLGCFSACGSGAEETAEPSGDGDSTQSLLDVEEIGFDLDGKRLLSTLMDEEIRGACESMVEVFDAADAGVSCQIVAAVESDEAACATKREDCLGEPDEALDETSVRAAPAPVDCSLFSAALTEGCDHPVSLLEDCVNALAQSVVPAAEAVSCEHAGEFDDIDDAQSEAVLNKGTAFAGICFDLLECEALVEALLSNDTGAGGASN